MQPPLTPRAQLGWRGLPHLLDRPTQAQVEEAIPRELGSITVGDPVVDAKPMLDGEDVHQLDQQQRLPNARLAGDHPNLALAHPADRTIEIEQARREWVFVLEFGIQDVGDTLLEEHNRIINVSSDRAVIL